MAGSLNLVVSGALSFRREWIAEGGRRVVPLASRSHLDEHLARRLSSGAGQAGHDHFIAGRVGSASVVQPEIEIPASQEQILQQLPWREGSFLVALPDLSGAVLVTDQGYSLIAGEGDFLRYGVPEGCDQAVVDFKRYAKRVGRSHPVVFQVSKEFQPNQVAWASRSDVSAGSATAEQVSLMDAFAANDISGEDFATAWLDARRRALQLRERLREPFSRILDQVFYALDDYVIDPRLRDPDDMTNEQLRMIIRGQLVALNSLERNENP
ncbi:colicin immunity domain-containing protein [Streptomyces sp. NPDC086554]|uniref:colicin immunity domain-containing protein n=1 Tax=Streptomyces sp. NPDC086554 TaxID=3154864 RepID=UPI003437F234